MGEVLHVTKRSSGWAVMRPSAVRPSSVHRTQAEAIATARRLAKKRGGAEIVVHSADGRIRDRDTVGAATLDELRKDGRASAIQRPPPPRAPRSEGSRTTLRLPEALAAVAERLASELSISRNDALLRLATRGARLYEAEHSIAVRRAERWAAVVPGAVDVDHTDLPSPSEAQDAILTARDDVRSSAT